MSAALVLGGAIALGTGWAASKEQRTTVHDVRGSVTRIALELAAGSATIIGGGDRATVTVRHTDPLLLAGAARPGEPGRPVE